MILGLTIAHVVIALALIVVVLMQHGKQQGLSGAIAGGAETFFGKNKGRTVDAMLKKFTSVVAVLFIITSIALAALTSQSSKAATDAVAPTTGTEAQQEIHVNEDGQLVDAEGNVIEIPAEGEEAPVDGASTAEEPAPDAAE